jgi:hypothetical protein
MPQAIPLLTIADSGGTVGQPFKNRHKVFADSLGNHKKPPGISPPEGLSI